MSMKSQIYSACVAGLSPLELLMKYGPDSQRRILRDPACGQACADLPRRPSRRKRTLLLILTLGLAIGAWQLLSHTDDSQSAKASAQNSAAPKSALRA
jgi:hypothetical protein